MFVGGTALAFGTLRTLLGPSGTATAIKCTKQQVRGAQEMCFPHYLSGSAGDRITNYIHPLLD